MTKQAAFEMPELRIHSRESISPHGAKANLMFMQNENAPLTWELAEYRLVSEAHLGSPNSNSRVFPRHFYSVLHWKRPGRCKMWGFRWRHGTEPVEGSHSPELPVEVAALKEGYRQNQK
jgi:hypothetical protein